MASARKAEGIPKVAGGEPLGARDIRGGLQGKEIFAALCRM